MQITAGIPDRIDEFITLEVAHFEPIRVAVVGEGCGLTNSACHVIKRILNPRSLS